MLKEAGEGALHAGLEILVSGLLPDARALAVESAGCRVLQAAASQGTTACDALLGALTGSLAGLVDDRNGNHVVQRMIETGGESVAKQLLDEWVASRGGSGPGSGEHEALAGMARHSFGCRVSQRVMERGGKSSRDRVAAAACSLVGELALDEYGTYVVQHLLQFGSESEQRSVVEFLSGSAARLACTKYGSAVLERCLERAAPSVRNHLVAEVSGLGGPGLERLAMDRFGNFVLQRVMGCGSDAQVQSIRNHLLSEGA